MGEVGFTIFVILFLVAVVAFGVLSYFAQKKRREELAALAASMGWRFDPAESDPWPEHELFDCFQQGHTPRAYNTITGSTQACGVTLGVLAGDYSYRVTRSNGKTTTTTTYRLSYVMLRTPFPDAPTLFIRREGFMDKVARAVGFDDIDFESEAFSRKFFVKSGSKKFAFDVISPAMMDYLMASFPGSVSFANGVGCITDGRQTWEAPEFRDRLEWFLKFFQLWPAYLIDQLQHTGGGGTA